MLSVPFTQPYTSTANVSQAEAAEAGTICRYRVFTDIAFQVMGVLSTCEVRIDYKCSAFKAIHVQKQHDFINTMHTVNVVPCVDQ